MTELKIKLDVVDEKYNDVLNHTLIQGNKNIVFEFILSQFGNEYTKSDNTQNLSVNLYVVANNRLDSKQTITESSIDPQIEFIEQLDEEEIHTGLYLIKIIVDTSDVLEALRYSFGNSMIFKITETNPENESDKYTYYTSHFKYNVKPNPATKI